MTKHDNGRINDVLDAARKALKFSAAKSRADLDDDELLALALIRLLIVVGEAAPFFFIWPSLPGAWHLGAHPFLQAPI